MIVLELHRRRFDQGSGRFGELVISLRCPHGGCFGGPYIWITPMFPTLKTQVIPELRAVASFRGDQGLQQRALIEEALVYMCLGRSQEH